MNASPQPGTIDYTTFWRDYDAGAWEPGTRAWVRAVVRPGDLFVDVGAWIGPVSLWALDQRAYVVAVEPDPIAAAELCRVLEPFTDAGRAEVWEGAIVASSVEEAWLAPNPKAGGQLGDSMSLLGTEFSNARQVVAWTLKDVLHGRLPNAVKIDVEGYETRLAPEIVPWLIDVGANVQVSCHGARPVLDGIPALFSFEPDERWGDLRIDPRQ